MWNPKVGGEPPRSISYRCERNKCIALTGFIDVFPASNQKPCFPASHKGQRSPGDGLLKSQFGSKDPRAQVPYLDELPHHSSSLQYQVNSLPKTSSNPRESMQSRNQTNTVCHMFPKVTTPNPVPSCLDELGFQVSQEQGWGGRPVVAHSRRQQFLYLFPLGDGSRATLLWQTAGRPADPTLLCWL